jgi:hypothetical protein
MIIRAIRLLLSGRKKGLKMFFRLQNIDTTLCLHAIFHPKVR